MGNRLVVTVMRENTPLFSLYWHWGAEGDFCDTVHDVLSGVLDGKKTLVENLKSAYNALHLNGIALNKCWYCDRYDEEIGDALELMKETGIPEATDRNKGMIAVTPTSMSEFEAWGDWGHTIYID